MQTLLVFLCVVAVLYGLGVAALVLAGRSADARALARFIPDCVVLLRRLLGDPGVSRSRKLAVVLLLAYLAMPLDLVPDFIPVAGQLDDVLVTALVLRFVVRGAGPELLSRHWPGPPQGAAVIGRLAFGAAVAPSAGQPSAERASRRP